MRMQGTYRIYHRGPHTHHATQRRTYGPVRSARFDHHHPQDPPGHDPEQRAVLYLADALRTAVRESALTSDARPLTPGGQPTVLVCDQWHVAYVEPEETDIVLQDLVQSSPGALGAPHDLGDGAHPRPVTQAWARAIYEDRPGHSQVAGMHYWSAKDRDADGDRHGANRVLWETSPSVRVRRPGRGPGAREEYSLHHPTIRLLVSQLLSEDGLLLHPIAPRECPSCRAAQPTSER